MSFRIIKHAGSFVCLPADQVRWSCIICSDPITENPPPWSIRTNSDVPLAVACCRRCDPPDSEFFGNLVETCAAAAREKKRAEGVELGARVKAAREAAESPEARAEREAKAEALRIRLAEKAEEARRKSEAHAAKIAAAKIRAAEEAKEKAERAEERAKAKALRTAQLEEQAKARAKAKAEAKAEAAAKAIVEDQEKEAAE